MNDRIEKTRKARPDATERPLDAYWETEKSERLYRAAPDLLRAAQTAVAMITGGSLFPEHFADGVDPENCVVLPRLMDAIQQATGKPY